MDLQWAQAALTRALAGLNGNGKVVYNLFLTEQCNFACQHCFYGCSPQGPKGYMSDELLYKIAGSIADLESAVSDYVLTSINYIGGEPTLNMREFRRCLGTMHDAVRSIKAVEHEMTTNGWWLKDPKFTREFLWAVEPHVQESWESGGLHIRISDSPHHAQFRPAWLQRKGSVGRAIDELIESGTINEEPVAWEEWSECDMCGARITYYADGEACEIEGCDGTMRGESDVHIDLRSFADGWIYAEDQWGGREVPSVANGGFGSSDSGMEGSCHRGNHGVLTFDPKGQLRDGCCRGSDFTGFGTIDDHPIVLLTLIDVFVRTETPQCWSCHNEAAQYVYDRKVARAKKLMYSVIKDVGWEELNRLAGGEA